MLIDASATYLFDSERVHLLLGPRLRTAGFGLAVGPIGLTAGLRAGVMNMPAEGLRFGLSPQMGWEKSFGRLLVNVGYATDILLGRGEATRGVIKSVGYLF